MVDLSLATMIGAENRNAVIPAATAMAGHLRTLYGPGVRAVVFYGSSMRLSTDKEMVLDFYVLVDGLQTAVGNPVSALFGALLPPNVYYQDCHFEDRTVRAKVAVMTLGAFARGTAETTFASAIWARFSQPTAIVYASDDTARSTVEQALTRAVTTLIAKTLPLMTGPFTTRDLWVTAFRATYLAELRPEAPTKADELVDADIDRYDSVGIAALTELGIDPYSPRFPKPAAGWIWRIRRWWGCLLNMLRLIKAAFTFKGGLDYAVWKIERHSGEHILLTDRDRAHPILTGIRLLLRWKW